MHGVPALLGTGGLVLLCAHKCALRQGCQACFSELALEQVPAHLPTRDPGGPPESGDVEGAGQAVGEAEEEHGRDPAARIFEGEAALGHLVLLDVAAAQVVHAALGIHLGFVFAGGVSELRAGQDVEVVVGGVAAGVAFGADRGSYGMLESSIMFTVARRGLGSPKMIRYSVTLA